MSRGVAIERFLVIKWQSDKDAAPGKASSNVKRGGNRGTSRCMRLAMVSAAALAAGAAAGEAQAGGFGVREQSTQYQGTSFAGSATGGNIKLHVLESRGGCFGERDQHRVELCRSSSRRAFDGDGRCIFAGRLQRTLWQLCRRLRHSGELRRTTRSTTAGILAWL